MMGAILPMVVGGNQPLTFDVTVAKHSSLDLWGYWAGNGTGSIDPDPAERYGDEVYGCYSGQWLTSDSDMILVVDGGAAAPEFSVLRGLMVASASGIRNFSQVDSDTFTVGTLRYWIWGDGTDKVWDASDISSTYTVQALV